MDGIYERAQLTNNGPLVQELTRRLESYLGVTNLLLVSNGTLALQVAYRALGVSMSDSRKPPEAVTTPFTFVATVSSLKWEGIKPVFADIHPQSWCLEPSNIEAAISPQTRTIVPVHVFGNACDVEAIDAIARDYSLKVIYDGAHAFGVTSQNQSLLSHGDATTLSFHATKLFHTIEGGAIIFKHRPDFERAKSMINFGIGQSETIEELGINAKMNEFQAAMGLCVLDEIDENLATRAAIWSAYESALGGAVQLQERNVEFNNNYAYFPCLLERESETVPLIDALRASGFQARRYFYPSLDTMPYAECKTPSMTSRDISSRVVCLPIYASLQLESVAAISELMLELTCRS